MSMTSGGEGHTRKANFRGPHPTGEEAHCHSRCPVQKRGIPRTSAPAREGGTLQKSTSSMGGRHIAVPEGGLLRRSTHPAWEGGTLQRSTPSAGGRHTVEVHTQCGREAHCRGQHPPGREAHCRGSHPVRQGSTLQRSTATMGERHTTEVNALLTE
jgi:hypothetical protein